MKLQQVYDDGLKSITKDMEAWKRFLTYSSQLYKYDFVDKVLLFQQKPNATYLADFDTWKSLGRSVKRKEKSAAVLSAEEGKSRVGLHYLFDISQTVGKKWQPPNWKVGVKLGEKILSRFYQDTFEAAEEEVPKFDKLSDLVSLGLRNVKTEAYAEILDKYQYYIEDSILYGLSQKADWLVTEDYLTELPAMTRQELEIVGHTIDHVSYHTLMRVFSIKEDLEKNIREEKKEDHKHEGSQGREQERNLDRQQTFRYHIEPVWQDRLEVPERTQSPVVSRDESRRDIDGSSQSETGMGHGAGDETGAGVPEERPVSQRDGHPGEGKTFADDLVSIGGDRDPAADRDHPGGRFPDQDGYFQRLEGNLPNNRYFRFTWSGGKEPIVYLDSNFRSIDPVFPNRQGHSSQFKVEEVPTQKKLVKLKAGTLYTRNIQMLYQSFEEISKGQSNRAFEKELFEAMKRFGPVTSGGSLMDDDLEWYRSYLDHLQGETLALDNENQLNMTELSANPFLKIGVVLFPEDKSAFLKFENDYHRDEHSVYKNGKEEESPPEQGQHNINYWALIEDPAMEALFEVEPLKRIRVRSHRAFKDFVEKLDGEITIEALRLERDLLHANKDQISFTLGAFLYPEELSLMEEHLELLAPFDDELEDVEIAGPRWLEKDPRIVPLHHEDWHEFSEDEDVFEDDGALYLNGSQGVQAGEIEVRKVSGGKEMYRFIRDNKAKDVSVSAPDLLAPDEGNNGRTPSFSSRSEGSSSPEKSFEHLDGYLPHNKYFRFTWHGGNVSMIRLSSQFTGLHAQTPSTIGRGAMFEVQEIPAMNEMIRINSNKVETRSKEELYQKFYDIKQGKSDVVFEKILFYQLKSAQMFNSYRFLDEKDLEWYRSYLDHLEGLPFAEEATKSLEMRTFSENPYLKVGIAHFPEDGLVYLKFENSFHRHRISEERKRHSQEEPKELGHFVRRFWVLIEDPSMRSLFKVKDHNKIYVRSYQEFQQFIGSLEQKVSVHALQFERDLLHVTQHDNGRPPKKRLSSEESARMEAHFDLIQPFVEELEDVRKVGTRWLENLPNDPEETIIFDSNWHLMNDSESFETVDGDDYLVDSKGHTQPQEIEIQEFKKGQYLYRYLEDADKTSPYVSYGEWMPFEDEEHSLVTRRNHLALEETESHETLEAGIHLKREDGESYWRAVNLKPKEFTVTDGILTPIKAMEKEASAIVSEESIIDNQEDPAEKLVEKPPDDKNLPGRPIGKPPIKKEKQNTIKQEASRGSSTPASFFVSPNEKEEVFYEPLSLFDFDDNGEYRIEFPETAPEPAGPGNYFPSRSTPYAATKREKAQDNLTAIKLLQSIESTDKEITLEEQELLARFSGWGGIPEIFDEKNGAWENERTRLKQLLSESEYSAARASVLTAFFTDPKIIEPIYDFISEFGDLSQASILDPAMGTGNFFQSLPEQWQGASLFGIELESFTGRIAEQLYPQAVIEVQGFESVELKDKFDLIVGNIPFNNIRVLDKKYDKHKFVIHDYFMAKSIDSLNSQGLMAFITSSGSMDKKDQKLREYLARRADLIGGIRLPKTAFKSSAGTAVISDILIFQKKTPAEMIDAHEEQPSWLYSREHPDHPGLFVNQYFIDHPERILGKIEVKNFQGQTMDVVFDTAKDLAQEISEAFTGIKDSLPEIKKINVVKRKTVPSIVDRGAIEVPAGTDKYSYFTVKGRAFYHTVNGEYEEIRNTNEATLIKDMLEVKRAGLAVLELQQSPYEDAELEKYLKTLNQTYDVFISRHGYFCDGKNRNKLRADNKYPFLMSLEKETKQGFEKQRIFYEATIRPKQVVTEVETVQQAINYSMATCRKLDLSLIQEIYPGHSIQEILTEAEGLIYLNPEKMPGFDKKPEEAIHAWEISDEYLTGNVKEKLNTAMVLKNRAQHPEMKKLLEKNIQALEKAQPERLLAGDIQFQIGSPWISIEVYDQFMHELLETPSWAQHRVYTDYLDWNASWRIIGKSVNNHSVVAKEKYGTSRIHAYEILEASLNLQQVTVRDREEDPDGKVKYVVNPEQTMIARGKQEDIENEFQKWLFADGERAEQLLDIYNDRFNTNSPRKYSGDDLVFEDMNLQLELRPHQKDVVARILYSGRALMAHEVGAGKTAAALTAGMYMKQQGMIHKPLFVVPNHITEQWGQEILTFYPNANVLVTTKKDFEKQNRQAFVSRIATGDYDAIVIGHSQFERIPLSPERQRLNIEREIREATRIVSELKAANTENWSVKQMERFKQNLEVTLEKLDNAERRDDVIDFEDLGVDFLFVDEAHAFKNLFIYTKMKNVAGVGSSRSQRASDMLSKIRYIQEEHDGRNVVFMTGTPVSNSMSELYVMQHFLQPDALKMRGLNSFDSWASTFGQVVSSLEINPEGSGYRMRNRFSKFHNLPELMTMFHEVADIQTAEMLDLPVPELDTGKVQTIVLRPSDFQKEKMEEFVVRSEAIRNGLVFPSEDNMLKLTHEAKLMAIDPRLLDSEQPRDPESKLSICCNKVFSIWEKTSPEKSAQIIFSDSGTPKADVFNVYQEIKDQLMGKGIPAEEIAFIHDAKTDVQRSLLFEKVRNGEVRVILGSTQKLGTGTNIQAKLIAAHHVDVPWKPSDLTQREGRILRQGNENKAVSIFRYVTKGTFDSYLWQIQEQKLTYISQVMTNNNINRSMDDLDETVLTAAEVKAVATGNPLLAQKMTLDNEITRLQLLRAQWENSRSRMERNIREIYPNKIAHLEGKLEKYSADLALIQKDNNTDFSIILGEKTLTSRKEAFEEIYANSLLMAAGEIKSMGAFKGLELHYEKVKIGDDVLILQGRSAYRTNFLPQTETGNMVRLSNMPQHIERMVKETRKEMEDTELQLASSKAEVDHPFEKQEELDQSLVEQREINQQMEFQTLKQVKSEEEEMEVEC